MLSQPAAPCEGVRRGIRRDPSHPRGATPAAKKETLIPQLARTKASYIRKSTHCAPASAGSCIFISTKPSRKQPVCGKATSFKNQAELPTPLTHRQHEGCSAQHVRDVSVAGGNGHRQDGLLLCELLHLFHGGAALKEPPKAHVVENVRKSGCQISLAGQTN